MIQSRRKRIPFRSDGVFSKNLHALMDGAKFADVAQAIGAHPETVNRYLNSGAIPTTYILVEICKLYRVPIEILTVPLSQIRTKEAALEAVFARSLRLADCCGFRAHTENLIAEYRGLK